MERQQTLEPTPGSVPLVERRLRDAEQAIELRQARPVTVARLERAPGLIALGFEVDLAVGSLGSLCGAFDPSGEDWTQGWTAYPAN